MKKVIVFCLALAMVLSMTGCGCKHESANMKLVNVDTQELTAQWEVSCAQCGEVLEHRDADTGVAPDNGTFRLSPEQWYACLKTNIQRLGASQSLIPHDAASEDNALVHGVVGVSGMLAVCSYWDSQDTVITTEQKDQQDLIHAIHIEGQFTNDMAPSFYMLLMIIAINNNQALAPEDANTLAAQIMSGNPATDNGYTYQMQILSVEEHTVRVTITAA